MALIRTEDPNHKSKEIKVKLQLEMKPCFTENVNNKLVNYCLEMESRFFGLTKRDISKIAFQIAKKNQLFNRFNKNFKAAGRKWFNTFMRRNGQYLSKRRKQPSSAAFRFHKRKYKQDFLICMRQNSINFS